MRNLTKDEIFVKVKQINEKGCLLLLYKTARVDAQILDETFGADKWVNDYKEIKGNLFCGIGVKGDDGQFIWKWDCGVESLTEAEKGEASDSFKRAGFKWGIGVELYTAPFIWAKVETVKNQKGGYELKDKFMKFNVTEYEVVDGKITKLSIADNKGNVVFSNVSSKPKAKDKAPQTFEQEATNLKTATTKALNKAIKEGTPLVKPQAKGTLDERYTKAVSWINSIDDNVWSPTSAQRDSLNTLLEDLKADGEMEKFYSLSELITKKDKLDDEIKY